MGKAKKPPAAKRAAAGQRNTQPLVAKQPQSKAAAATEAGVFLHTDDAWSLAYFDPNDLHNRERELFANRD